LREPEIMRTIARIGEGWLIEPRIDVSNGNERANGTPLLSSATRP
jgi:hypothetical protein